jgi:hypothetical protein
MLILIHRSRTAHPKGVHTIKRHAIGKRAETGNHVALR